MVRADPYRGFRFVVEADGTTVAGFQTITGIERQTRTEPYREGGVNDFEHQIAGVTTYPPLVLKRGLADTTLWDWHQQVIGGGVQRRTVSVILLDDNRAEAWRWICLDAYPARWVGAELDALADAVATESVELVHRGITRQ
ncbi:phage tail protein [Streptomyces sp. NPDC016845]|uniref:phage tail protein n=1 Tax=Streptomyces sp. NPDC016845 TaxID=3364972 RepID=UPI0037AA9CD0